MNSGAWLISRRGVHQLAPLVVRDRAVAQPIAVHLGHRAQQPVAQLDRRHFQADEQHRHAGVHRRVLGHVHGQRRLAHAGPRGQDDQLRLLQPAGELVEVVEPRLHAAEGVLVIHAGVDAVERLLQHLGDRRHLPGAAVFENREDPLLGLAENLARFARGIVGAVAGCRRSRESATAAPTCRRRSGRSTRRGPPSAPARPISARYAAPPTAS